MHLTTSLEQSRFMRLNQSHNIVPKTDVKNIGGATYCMTDP